MATSRLLRSLRTTALAALLAVAGLAAPVGLPSASAGLIVLGAPMDEYSEGFGTSRPGSLSQNGLCANAITGIAWDNWGAPVARGNGMWCHSAGAISRGEPPRPVTLTASGMGLCQGKIAYRTLQYDAGEPFSICQG